MIWEFLFKDSDMSFNSQLYISLSFCGIILFLIFIKPEIKKNFKKWENIYGGFISLAFIISLIIYLISNIEFETIMYSIGYVISVVAIIGLVLMIVYKLK